MFNFFLELKSKYQCIKNKVCPYKVVALGNYLVYIEGKLSVMLFEKENIVIRVLDGVITVRGDQLEIKDITENSISIVGKICSWEHV